MKPISPRVCIAVLFMLLAVTAAQAQKIKVEFDKNVDFSKLKTYAWDPTPQATGKPVLVAAIKGAVNEELAKRGLKQVAENPDLYIAMYGSVDSDMAVTYSDLVLRPVGNSGLRSEFPDVGSHTGNDQHRCGSQGAAGG